MDPHVTRTLRQVEHGRIRSQDTVSYPNHFQPPTISRPEVRVFHSKSGQKVVIGKGGFILLLCLCHFKTTFYPVFLILIKKKQKWDYI